MANPACTVKDGAGAATSTTNGVNVTPGNTVTIALASTADVDVWSLLCISTDDSSAAATVNASLTIDAVAKTATYTAPAAGHAYRFQSVVNSGRDRNFQIQSSYSTTFGIYTVTGGNRVLAVDETFESNSVFGWIAPVNAMIRGGGGGGGGTVPSGTGFTHNTAGSQDVASKKVDLAASADVTGTLPVGNGGTGITSIGSGVATFLGTPSGANLASALTTALPVSKGGTNRTALGTGLQVLRTNAGATDTEWATVSGGTTLPVNLPTVTKTANYTIVAGTDYRVICLTTPGITITLPASPTTGDQYEIKNLTGGSISVAGNSGGFDNGSSPYTLPNGAGITVTWLGGILFYWVIT